LSRVLTGGESLTPALIERFYEQLPTATLYNMYGPTETTVAVTGRSHTAESLETYTRIGGPKCNTRVYVLDDGCEPVPVGVVGELHVGGVQVARGYAGRPSLTAERFIPDPFRRENLGGRLYRTGDLGRWLQDGTIEFLGRRDDQVKVRGYRIELGEIVARLTEHPHVREATVLAREKAPGDKQLVAYWVGAEEAEDISVEALRTHLIEVLPEYMVPAAYVRLESLPLLSSGKVDARALPMPQAGAYAMRGYEAPVGETETALSKIWSEVLGVGRIGRHDHFFELGGHSLLATKLVVRINEQTGTAIALRDVFETPVLSGLAARILQTQLAQFDTDELGALI
jgi:non-ribosomal peptide synthetase component F